MYNQNNSMCDNIIHFYIFLQFWIDLFIYISSTKVFSINNSLHLLFLNRY